METKIPSEDLTYGLKEGSRKRTYSRMSSRSIEAPEVEPRTMGEGLLCRKGAHTEMCRMFPPRITIQDFDLLKVLGRGSFGKVFLGREKSSEQVFAIKMLDKSIASNEADIEQTLMECHILRAAKHPFLIGLRYSFQNVDHLFYVMEYVGGGDLCFHLTKVNKFTEKRTRFYAAEIILGLEYLHGQDIIYRDLKPENLLLDKDGHIKIADFGLSKAGLPMGKTTRTFCGTPEYLAPEILIGEGYGHAIDWWSLGVTMYVMMCGGYPFADADPGVQYEMIKNDEVGFPASLTPNARALLHGLLIKDPEARLGGGKRKAEDIKEHAFFCSISWEQILRKELKPPFEPQIASDVDTSNFDPEFTEEKVDIDEGGFRGIDGCHENSRHLSQFSFYGSPSVSSSRKGTQMRKTLTCNKRARC